MALRDRLASVPVLLRNRANPAPGPPSPSGAGHTTECAAPATQLRFDPNGLVTTCCRSLQPLGHVGQDRLADIWAGERRRRMVAALGIGDFGEGCQRCGTEIDTEGRDAAYARAYDGLNEVLAVDGVPEWPLRMEFNLSNVCNLQCIQCDGESSSMIRLHREGRPPLPKAYGDDFFDDLVPFLPHLRRAVFAGGEPFLAPENFRVWDLVAAHAPELRTTVVTNATQWSPRIAAVFERVRPDVVVSLDGITPSTYESIRVGADLAAVLANVDRMLDLVRSFGRTMSINHCLMPQNHHEFADLLRWADERDLTVDVCVVRSPAHASIARLAAGELAAVHESFQAADPRVGPSLSRNRAVWEAERDRVAAWVAAADDGGSASHTVLFFPCRGAGPVDDQAALAELRAFAGGGDVVRVAIGVDDAIRWCDSTELADPDNLIGRSYQDLNAAVSSRYGELVHYEVVHTGEDRIDAHARFGDHEARITFVAVRDRTGWADVAHILVAVAGADQGAVIDGPAPPPNGAVSPG